MKNVTSFTKCIIDKCSKCIYGISFEQLNCGIILECEKQIKEKDKQIEDLKHPWWVAY